MSKSRFSLSRFTLRRLAAVMAMLGLLFASTVASLSHSVAMPAMKGAMIAAGGSHENQMRASHASYHDEGHHDHDSATAASHDHTGHSQAAVGAAPPAMPCDQGCLLCKDCFLSSFVLLSPMDFGFGVHYADYGAAEPCLGNGITPARLQEPPRV